MVKRLRCGCVTDGDDVTERCPDALALRAKSQAAFAEIVAAIMDDGEHEWEARVHYREAMAAELHHLWGKITVDYVNPTAKKWPDGSVGRQSGQQGRA